MRKITLTPLFVLLFALACFADKGGKKKENASVADSASAELNEYVRLIDSVNSAMKYQTGHIVLSKGNATLDLPPGFKFLNAEQSQFVLNKLWNNPKNPDVLGMIMPENNTPFTDSSYVFIVKYEDDGYVKDDDAKDIDYTKMLKDIQDGEPELNKQRAAQGFAPVHVVGWAAQPFYDDKQKVLHWAKEARFGEDSVNTLNYEVRVLGRKGLLSLTAIAAIHELPLVKNDIDKVLHMASFNEGSRYSDYNSGTDKIAEYTVGGLVAGTILTKVGFWAVIAKFAKLIFAGIVAAFYGVRKWLTGKGRKQVEPEKTAEETPVEEVVKEDPPAGEKAAGEEDAPSA